MCVKNVLNTISTGQSTHQDFVEKSSLLRILFYKSCLWRIFFYKKSSSQSFCDAFNLKFLVLSTNSLVVKMIRTPILSDLNDTICTKQ